MQKVTRNSLMILIPLVVVVVFAGVYLADEDDAPAGAENRLDDMLDYVPADTPLFFAGRGTAESLEYSDAFLRRANPQDMEPMLELLDHAEEGSALPMLRWLLEDYTLVGAAGGLSAITERYGWDPMGAYALYFHGAAPVLRLSLDNADALADRLAEAEADTGVSAREEALGDATLRIWPLANDPEIELALLLEPNALTVSLVLPEEDEAARLQRFAREPAAESLRNAEAIEALRSDFAQAEVFGGYVDFHQIARALLLPEQNSMGRELKQWLADEHEPFEELSDGCRRDYVQLASQAPRLSMGLHSMQVQGQDLNQHLGLLWAIENSLVVESLQRLQGFVPAYSRRSDDKLAAFALGADLSELVPVATDLWTQFLNAEFECEQLQQMQQGVQAYNPAMLAMMGAAMVDSVRGIGAALYDLDEGATSPQGLVGSFLVSLSSENPEALAALASAYLPQLAGVTIPGDGTAVDVPNIMGVSGIQAAIKGNKHLVLFRGEPAQEDAEALAGESLESTGLTGAAFNTRQQYALLDASRGAFRGMGMLDCGAAYGGVLSLSHMAMEMSWGERFTDRGWSGELDITMAMPAILDADSLAGQYEMALLDSYDCQWYPVGREELSADGTGQFIGTDDEGCENYQSEFNWELTGSLMEQETQLQRERFNCDAEWNELGETDDFSCVVLADTEEGFYCLREANGETELYRYRLQ